MAFVRFYLFYFCFGTRVAERITLFFFLFFIFIFCLSVKSLSPLTLYTSHVTTLCVVYFILLCYFFCRFCYYHYASEVLATVICTRKKSLYPCVFAFNLHSYRRRRENVQRLDMDRDVKERRSSAASSRPDGVDLEVWKIVEEVCANCELQKLLLLLYW